MIVDIECPACDGTGEETYEDHHPDCDGDECGRFGCPVEWEEECSECGGTGYIEGNNPLDDDPDWPEPPDPNQPGVGGHDDRPITEKGYIAKGDGS